jgi:hypothetical protein
MSLTGNLYAKSQEDDTDLFVFIGNPAETRVPRRRNSMSSKSGHGALCLGICPVVPLERGEVASSGSVLWPLKG